MATTTQLGQIAADGNFQNRVKYFLYKAAIAIMAESALTASHADRVTYAQVVLSGQADIHGQSIGVLTNPTIAADANASNGPDWSITDGNIEFQINSQYNAYAGVAN